MADLDPDALNKLKVVELREHLSQRGLPTAGLKAELVKRLRAALIEENNSRDSDSPQEDEEVRIEAEKALFKEEEEASQRAAEEARLRAEEAAHLRAEEEARLRAEEEARLRAEEEARLRAKEEEARLRAEEEARLRAEKEARLKAEEEARLRAEEETRLRAEEEARLRAEEEARLRAEEEARLKAEEEARLRAEEKARLRAEEEARLRAEEEALLREEEEARSRAMEKVRLKAEEEARRKALVEAKRKEEEEAFRKALKEARQKAEEEAEKARLKKEEEACLRAAEEARLKAEVEARLRAEEEARLREEEEAHMKTLEEARLKAEEEARIKASKEAKRKEEEGAFLKAIKEARQKAEEDQKHLAEEERSKKEFEQQKMSTNNDVTLSEKAAFQSHASSTLQMPPMPPFSLPSMNIMSQPPTVLMSNIPLLPPGTSHHPTLSNASALTSIFPPPLPPMMAPLVSLDGQELNVDQSEIDANDISESMDTDENSSEIKLPQVLEKVLALKTVRAQELGIDPDTALSPGEERAQISKAPPAVNLVSLDDEEYGEEEDASSKRKGSKNRRRKKKKKKRQPRSDENKTSRFEDNYSERDSGIDVDIEYVQEVIDASDPLYHQFMRIFEKFKLTENEKENEETAADAAKSASKEEMFNPMAIRKKPVDLDDDDEKDDDKLEEEKPKLSKRKLKKLSRMSVAELKQKVNRPELVEMHDVTAKDPVLLLHLKASRNTVPVPRHWCFKRKYLQGKRGIEKPAFELPDFIKRTGIMEMRQALQEKEDQKTMKAKMRERVRPKLGKIDIDYQKLHDAFFKWQTKPKMTIHGDLYYEGKEFETRLKEKKPGDLSEDLRTALGMPTGPNANKCPPPWLIAMQRYGPPPSYPNLKIPGLNAPIPDSCSFGYHAGGWGKPPVDETGRPLYGDVFGTQISDNQPHIQEEEIDHTLWGELESESSEEEEDEEEEEEDEEEEDKVEDETGLVTPAEGLITPSGFSSIPAGMETPDMIELRKRKIEAEMEGGETPALYTILPEKKTERVGAAMMGSTHIYDIAAAIPGSKLKAPGTASVPPQGIEVALDPSELEMDTAAMAARYEQTMREQQSQLEKEDLSDMVAEHAARQKNKRKKQQLDSAKPPKKYKEFKF